MATRNTPREPATGETDMASAQNAVADATRQQMANTASTTSAMLRALDTFQTTQQHMVQRAALLQEQTAERLRHAQTPFEVMSIQSSMMLSGVTDLAQYAQELMIASLKAQGEFMRPGDQQQAATASPTTTATPLFQAWQAMFNPALNPALNPAMTGGTAGAMGGATATRHH